MHSVESYNISKFFGIPGRTLMLVNDHIQGNTAIYMAQYYGRKFPCRVRRNTIVHERGKRAYTIYGYFFRSTTPRHPHSLIPPSVFFDVLCSIQPIVYGCRRSEEEPIYVYRIHARFPFCSVYLSTQLCFSIYDITMCNRNTEPCNTAKYGRDMIVKESYTTI